MADMFADLQGLGLSPQEFNKVAYHRSNLGNPYMDNEGRPVTIYSTGIEIPEGKYKGKFVSVPGYVNGQIIQDEDTLYKIWKNDIKSNKWPIYQTSEELNKRDQWLHQIMDKDVEGIVKRQPYMPFESLFYEDSPLR